MNILPGSKITGASGKTLVVDRLEGEILICGDRRIKVSAVVEVIPPEPSQPPANIEPSTEAPAPLAVGDTVYCCGDRYWEQYRAMPLVLVILREGYWTASKPDGYRTTNLSAKELSRSPVERPKFKTARSPQKGQWLREWELEQKRKY